MPVRRVSYGKQMKWESAKPSASIGRCGPWRYFRLRIGPPSGAAAGHAGASISASPARAIGATGSMSLASWSAPFSETGLSGSVAFGTMPVASTTMSSPAIGTSWPSSASSTVTVRSAPTDVTLPFTKTMPSSWAWR